ncbi:MAG: carbohydrate ABC transporter permease [Lachnospiraceae bacterium]|nr:carbohydrate ABC transporter permease [Lachnospiraceae bacterium]
MRNLKKILFELIMICLAIVWFLPVYYLAVTTLKTQQDATLHPLALPSHWEFGNYINAWVKMEFPRALFNTFIITVSSVCILIFIGAFAGYALARAKNKTASFIFMLFLAGLIVPFHMNIISLYKIVKNMGLMNKLLGVILVDVAINMPQTIFLFKEFIENSVPWELEEAAIVDGCDVTRRVLLIVVPLLKPVVSTTVIIVTLNVWNEFMTPLLFLQSRAKGVILQEVSRNIGQFSTDWATMFPMLMLGVLPLIIFYIFMQKYIIAGVAAGGVKG